MADLYKEEIVDPGDQASRIAKKICLKSFGNNKAVTIVSHQPDNFRGPIGFLWNPHILEEMSKCKIDPITGRVSEWTVLIEVENDGAGGKPQFFVLVGKSKIFRRLGWEIITMTADDFARSGRFPAILDNEINVKKITKKNLPHFIAMMKGYGAALKKCNLINITGEIAVMKHSITAFCDTGSDDQLIITWGASCIGIAHKDLLIDNSRIKPGMHIVGFWEPGYRCNGGTFFTNLIKLVFGPDVKDIMKNKKAIKFAEKLTIPSVSYAKTITRIVGWNLDGSAGKPLAKISGAAHITGGGVWGKFGEILPEGVGAHLDSMPDPASILLEAQDLSWNTELRLTDWQAHGTLHGGCGMFLVTPTKRDAQIIIREARKDGIKAQIVGRTTESSNREIVIESRFKERKTISSLKPE